MVVTAYIGVGSNLGDRRHLIECAQAALMTRPAIKFLRRAPIYETRPVGGPPQGLYLNTVWEIETGLSAGELLEVLLAVEKRLGRERREKNGPRTIDLDLLFYGDEVIKEGGLVVPHPRLHERWFVLKPLWDLRADFVHPVFEKSVCELLDQVGESSEKSSTPHLYPPPAKNRGGGRR